MEKTLDEVIKQIEVLKGLGCYYDNGDTLWNSIQSRIANLHITTLADCDGKPIRVGDYVRNVRFHQAPSDCRFRVNRLEWSQLAGKLMVTYGSGRQAEPQDLKVDC